MAQSINRVLLLGNVGKDAELRQTQQGVPYAHFTLATSTGGYTKKDGTQVPKRTEWHNGETLLRWPGSIARRV